MINKCVCQWLSLFASKEGVNPSGVFMMPYFESRLLVRSKNIRQGVENDGNNQHASLLRATSITNWDYGVIYAKFGVNPEDIEQS